MPVATAAGNSPIAAPIVAMKIGRICTAAACMIASRRFNPALRPSSMREISNTPPRIATPKVEMMPTAAEMLKFV